MFKILAYFAWVLLCYCVFYFSLEVCGSCTCLLDIITLLHSLLCSLSLYICRIYISSLIAAYSLLSSCCCSFCPCGTKIHSVHVVALLACTCFSLFFLCVLFSCPCIFIAAVCSCRCSLFLISQFSS